MKLKKIMIICLLVANLISLTGCSNKQSKICTTSYAISYLVNKIGGELIEIYNVSSDDLIFRAQLKEGAIEQIENSLAFIHISGLEPYYEMYSNEISKTNATILDLSLYAAIYDFKRYTYVKNNGVESLIETSYYNNASFSLVDTFTRDPILWMDPIAMISMAKAIRDFLIEKMPESESYFRSNYAKLESELALLDAEFQTIRTDGKSVKIVTITASFGNWQKAYGIQVYPVILSKYGVLPNSLQLEAFKKRIVEDGVMYIAKETNLPADMQALYDALVEEMDLKEVTLHNLNTLTEDNINNNEDYLKLMYDNLTIIESICE